VEPAQRGAGACDLALLALTSNLVFSDWKRIFKDSMATAAESIGKISPHTEC